MIFWRRNSRISKLYSDISPEDILADTKPLTLEGVNEKVSVRIGYRAIIIITVIFSAILLLFTGRLFFLQVAQGEEFATKSANNHLDHDILFAPRGIIYDRNGDKLAWNDTEQDEESGVLKRVYTTEGGFAHVLGFVNYPKRDTSGFFYDAEYSGIEGVEGIFNDSLSGQNGLRILEKDALGEIQSQNTIVPIALGEEITLSIDAGIQQELFNEIQSLADQVDFYGGAGVIMDIYTGEIIALVSYPEFSSTVMTDGVDVDRIEEYVSSDRTPFLNRVTQGLYTPGSVVKPFMAIAALNEKVIRPEDKIRSTGEIRVENPYVPDTYSTFRDWKPGGHGLVDVVSALADSVNTYFYAIGGGYGSQQGIGIEKIYTYARAFDLGVPTGILGFKESQGVIPNPQWKKDVFDGEDWRLGDTYHTAIGQYGFQVTPLQMARAVGAIAREGVLVTPVILKDGQGHEERVSVSIDSEYYTWIQKGMRASVETGTAGGLNTSSVAIAGKTGTAEVGIEKKRVNSWVTGYFPYSNPRYSFAIVMEKGPRGNLIGATAVMRRVVDWMTQNTPHYFE